MMTALVNLQILFDAEAFQAYFTREKKFFELSSFMAKQIRFLEKSFVASRAFVIFLSFVNDQMSSQAAFFDCK